MAKYKMTSNQMKTLNTVFKRIPENIQKIIEEHLINQNIDKMKIGGENYSKAEVERFKKKELIEVYAKRNLINLDSIFKKSKVLNRASFNSIPTILKLKEIDRDERNQKIKKIENVIQKIEKEIQEEVNKISLAIYKSFKSSYKKSLNNTKRTQKSIELKKIADEIRKNIHKKYEAVLDVVDEYNKYGNEWIIEQIDREIDKNLNEEEVNLIKLNGHGMKRYEGWRKQSLDMRKWDYVSAANGREALWRSGVEGRAFSKKEKEYKEIMDKYKTTEDIIEPEHLQRMTAPVKKLKSREKTLEEPIKVKGEEIDISGLNIGDTSVYLTEGDTYEPNRYNDIHIINVQADEFGNTSINWDDYDSWSYIPKEYEQVTEFDFQINPGLQSKNIQKKTIEKIKSSKKIESLILKKKEAKKQIEAIKSGKKVKKIVSKKNS
jgi:hypothetical protein